ncbi:hypothetical protein P22_1985 [Propionispora sp. 2/2-37]|uniref:DNA-methyltransferase n=1 Tax=Propionispora sp. 2/2-37 TaxID=1677858 RepID=UPI0006BB67A2|nr:DNA methyltransferase [Propionispora sp. 2/2-37]CUH95899.1 hypothetical protein P22_1985 [Propionispora sp. 2/2-37]
MNVLNQAHGERWALYHGDCCEVLDGLPENSVDYSIFSPPFASLYTYSNSERDIGNNKDYRQFAKHMRFLALKLFRVMKPGRNVSIHCMDIPLLKERDGIIGLRDFRGHLIRIFQRAGFILHSQVTIWKDPLVEATRTKAIGLMHKQLVKDSAMCRQGLPDYLVTLRKPGVNQYPITHENGLTEFAGEDAPQTTVTERPGPDPDLYAKKKKYNETPVYSHQVWRRYASPVWMDIRQTNTLNRNPARDTDDERHICPLQLDVIERALTLWTNPGDVTLDPFNGISSTGYQAIKMDRYYVGIELKGSYFNQGTRNLSELESELFIEKYLGG